MAAPAIVLDSEGSGGPVAEAEPTPARRRRRAGSPAKRGEPPAKRRRGAKAEQCDADGAQKPQSRKGPQKTQGGLDRFLSKAPRAAPLSQRPLSQLSQPPAEPRATPRRHAPGLSLSQISGGSSQALSQRTREEPTFSARTDAAEILRVHAPERMQDLISGKSRNEDVLRWLGSADAPPVLLLCGPSGCGKMSLVSAAARSHSLRVRVWEEYQAFGTSYSTSLAYDVRGRGEDRVGESQLQLFRKALTTERSAQRAVVGGACHAGHVVVCRGLPFCFTADQRRQRDSILHALARSSESRSSAAPVVILFTTHDTHSSKFQLHQEFPTPFLHSPAVRVVEMKGVSDAQMRKRLDFLATRERMAVPRQELLRVVAGAQGDFRQAVHQMCFTALPKLPREAEQTALPECSLPLGRLSNPCDDDRAPPGATRDTSIDIGHGCSRLLSAKRDEAGVLNHPAEETLRLLGTPPRKILDYFQANLPRYCQVPNALELLAMSTRRLSESDCYLSSLQSDTAQGSVSGWAARLGFRWGVDGYQSGNRTPSRPRAFEPSHPPPHWEPIADSPFTLQHSMAGTLHPDVAPFHSARRFAVETCPALAGILLRSRTSYVEPPSTGIQRFRQRPRVTFRLTRAQVQAVRALVNFTAGQWQPGESSPPPPCDAAADCCPAYRSLPAKWQQPFLSALPYDFASLSSFVMDTRCVVDAPPYGALMEQGFVPAELADDPIEED
eukprot:TRINITY_DN25266_c0_g1_i1.p1 TRINITY_DN25266_c0_g1~~TRINITY_DN25266_c0_g1_i1.p1  ORF type:complete len:748 (+),score=169.76 TRINITY_DN25266_c0_g1_i1:71-2245(+)